MIDRVVLFCCERYAPIHLKAWNRSKKSCCARSPFFRRTAGAYTDIYNIYNIYPFSKMPANPVLMRVCGKPQSGNFSYLKWQFLVPRVAFSRTQGGNFSGKLGFGHICLMGKKSAVYAGLRAFFGIILKIGNEEICHKSWKNRSKWQFLVLVTG